MSGVRELPKEDSSESSPASIGEATSVSSEGLSMESESSAEGHCACSKCAALKCRARKGRTAKGRKGDHRCCQCARLGYGFPRLPVSLPPTAAASFDFLQSKKSRDAQAGKALRHAVDSLAGDLEQGTRLVFPAEAKPHEDSASSESSEEDSEDDAPAGHCLCGRCYSALCKQPTRRPQDVPDDDDLRCCDCVRKLQRSPTKLEPWEMRLRVHFHKMAKKARANKLHLVSLYDSLGLREMDEAIAVSLMEKSRLECQRLWERGEKVFIPEGLRLTDPPSDSSLLSSDEEMEVGRPEEA